jgi:cell division protein ZapE
MTGRAAEGPIFGYRERLAEGAWRPDPIQELAVEKLQILHHRLGSYRAVKGSTWLERLRGNRREPPPVGLYLHGGVGRGKTALMDLMSGGIESQAKRRAHFHAFMLDVHARIHAWRQLDPGKRDGDDPIRPVAKALASEASLLCLDEFQVNDVADAMILRRLFSKLFQNGVVVVTTSNITPEDLYAGGLNRDQFLPFIELIKANLEVFHLDSSTDYRLRRLQGAPVYFCPHDAAAEAGLATAFEALSDGAAPQPAVLDIKGRDLRVPAAAGSVARFDFADLCGQPLGAADYLEIARQYHTVVLGDIPHFTAERRDEARRFINLIDLLYEHYVNLICSAASEPDGLCAEAADLAAFGRTASRLAEMRSESYLAAPHLA